MKHFDIRQDVMMMDNDGNVLWEWFETFTPNNGIEESYEEDCVILYEDVVEAGINYVTVYNIFPSVDTGYIFELNKKNTITLENFYYRLLQYGKQYQYIQDIDTIVIEIEYTDGDTEIIEVNYTMDSDNSIDVTGSFTPSKNVTRFSLAIFTDLSSFFSYAVPQNTFTCYLGETKGDNKYNFNVDVQSEEASLLSGLIGWVTNIFNKVGEIFDKMGEISSMLLQLPEKLWIKISNGLKALFIPTSEDIEQFSANMDTLLESKLGAVYQVSNTVIESWERIQESDETDTINFPEVTINLPENNTFTFGGYNVKIVPDGFSFIVTSVKMVVGIVCTIAFVNGLRKKYDDVMEG